MRRDQHELGRFLTALATFVFVAVVMPLGAIAASQARFGSANPLAGVDPPWHWFGGSSLSEPVADDTVVDALIRLSLCAIWVVAVVVVVTTVLEIVHLVRHRGLAMPSVRGLGWAQRIARFIAAGLLVAMPMLTSTASVAGVPRGPVTAFSDAPSTVVQPRRTPSAASTADAAVPSSEHTHIVRPGESIYSIAQGLAGSDDARVITIADAIIEANLGATVAPGQRFTNAAYVEAGWILQIPAEFARAAAPQAELSVERVVEHLAEPASDVYEVQPGDTLWDIADEQLGDPTLWTGIWERNAGDDMGGGRTFDDPDLILPGWDLELSDEPAPAIEITSQVEPDVVPDGEPDVVPDAQPEIVTDAEPAPTGESTVDPPSTAPVAESAGPLPLVPEESTGTAPDTTATTTTTVVPIDDGTTDVDEPPATSPDAPSPIRLEHAALLAAGILALVGVRRQQRLRAARPRHRVPEPRPEVMITERRLRAVDAGERALRVDVACRAAAWSMIDTGAQIGWVRVSIDGDVEIRTTAPVALPAPWSPRSDDGRHWQLGAEVPIELLGEDARRVGMPCVALVQLGVNDAGDDVLVDIEACGVLAVEARPDQAGEVITGLAAGLASSMYAEVAHLIGVALAPEALLGHRNAHRADSLDDGLELAAALVGTTAHQEHTTFELRSLRTGGEMWEPAILLLGDTTAGSTGLEERGLPAGGHGVGVVVAVAPGALADAPVRLVGTADGWALHGFGTSIDLRPVGLTADDLAAVDEVLVDAERPLEPVELGSADDLTWADSDTSDTGRSPGTHDEGPGRDEAAEPIAPFATDGPSDRGGTPGSDRGTRPRRQPRQVRTLEDGRVDRVAGHPSRAIDAIRGPHRAVGARRARCDVLERRLRSAAWARPTGGAARRRGVGGTHPHRATAAPPRRGHRRRPRRRTCQRSTTAATRTGDRHAASSGGDDPRHAVRRNELPVARRRGHHVEPRAARDHGDHRLRSARAVARRHRRRVLGDRSRSRGAAGS